MPTELAVCCSFHDNPSGHPPSPAGMRSGMLRRCVALLFGLHFMNITATLLCLHITVIDLYELYIF